MTNADESAERGDPMLATTIASEVAPGVVYRIVSCVGEGAMGVAYYALRVAPEGECPVVVKVMRPEFVRQLGRTAALIVKKEAIALGRLNERVPATPFVVRFIDTGVVMRDGVELPWVAVEYVHGGLEGTTLTERVTHSLRTTGYAFEPERAAHAIEALASGLMAVHEMGVIHRDLKPDNVLCCGFGSGEILKIADFGVARPVGVAATFGGMVVGTLGYAAPELAAMDQRAIGAWSDVFSLASVVYFLLTGEEYFPTVTTPSDAIMTAVDPSRRSIRDAARLSPDLRAREQACRSIDFALACATSAKIENRPQRADAVAAMLLPWVRGEHRRPRVVRRAEPSLDDDDVTTVVGWQWTVLHRPTGSRLIRSVAWDGDGRCLAATNSGLSFWDGTGFRDVNLDGLPNPEGIRFVRRVAPGRWLVGGDDATVATLTADGVTDVFRLDDGAMRFVQLSGELDDLAVLVGVANDRPPTLCALSSRRWLKPLPLPQVAFLSSLARIGDDRWLLSGRKRDGGAFAAIYSPLDWEFETIPAPDIRAFLSCAGQWERGVGLITGADGAAIWLENGRVEHEHVEGDFDLAAAGVDPVGRGWTGGAGRIWLRQSARPSGGGPPIGRWECLWSDPRWISPIVSIFPDIGAVAAMSADGGIVEGRVERAG